MDALTSLVDVDVSGIVGDSKETSLSPGWHFSASAMKATETDSADRGKTGQVPYTVLREKLE
jgi:hypothetical protein